jgi:all-trans-retinol dehydrogenase (NAD+)
VRQEVGAIDILFNNAGIVSGKSFLDLPDAQIEATFRINTMALFWTGKAFLPDMIARNRGHVVTMGSASGYVGVAKLSDYAASKWAAVGFDESLRVELKRTAPGIVTTIVCPYYINTGMFRGVKTRFPLLLPILEEQVVADRIVRAIQRNKRRLVMPRLVGLVPLMRVLPVPVFDAVANFLGVNRSMDEFAGRDSGRSTPA